MPDTLKQFNSLMFSEKLTLAKNYSDNKNYEEAVKIYLDLIEKIDDEYVKEKSEVYCYLGNCYYYLNDYDNAIWAYENSLKYYKNNESIINMLGYMYFYKNSGKSIEYYVKGMELKPNFKNYIMLTQMMLEDNTYSQKDLKTFCEKYVDYFRPQVLNGATPFSYDKNYFNPDKKLKIGYLSSDFYCHAMMSFVLPIIENHNLDKFDVVLYSHSKKSDVVTQRLKDTGVEFRDCSDLDNKQLAEFIHNEKTDILVDLSGYTHDCIWSLLFKPAPLIGQYLGFLGTYGMKEVDFIIADEFTIPKNISKFYTEKPLYLSNGMNRFTFNAKKENLPDITSLPYEKNQYITFGSFNRPSKINQYTISLWSKVLHSVENSKLLIYRTQMQERDIKRLKSEFAKNGIAEDRIIFDNEQLSSRFLAYIKCDVALDPFPFSGLTITIEQCMMGVPALTMAGETLSSKGTSRVNKTIGLDDFVSFNEDEFVKNAVRISSDINKLKFYRQNLRSIIEQSPICNDFKEYVKDLEDNYVQMWQNFVSKHE